MFTKTFSRYASSCRHARSSRNGNSRRRRGFVAAGAQAALGLWEAERRSPCAASEKHPESYKQLGLGCMFVTYRMLFKRLMYGRAVRNCRILLAYAWSSCCCTASRCTVHHASHNVLHDDLCPLQRSLIAGSSHLVVATHSVLRLINAVGFGTMCWQKPKHSGVAPVDAAEVQTRSVRHSDTTCSPSGNV